VRAAVALVALVWLALVAAGGVMLAGRAAGLAGPVEERFRLVTPPMVWAAALVFGACLLSAVVTRALRPGWTLPLTFATSGLVLMLAAAGSGAIGALIGTVAMVALAWLVGEAALSVLPPGAEPAVVRWPLAAALGLGVQGLLLFLLAAVGQLAAGPVGAGAALLLALASIGNRARLRTLAASWRTWRPETPSWLETIAVGLSAGLVAYALLVVFTPENISDALADHLPIARETWQRGAIPVLAEVSLSRSPIQAHLLYAVAWGFGGQTAVKLVHAAAGLVAIGGVASIGWLVAGRVAAVVGAALFASTPVTLWMLGHAFPDLFPALFIVTAVLAVLIWQRDGAPRWLVAAGLLAGFGVATKTTAGLAAAGLVVALFLVGRGPWRWRERLSAVALFALGGGLVAAPWLVRTYLLTGTISGDLNQMAGVILGKVPGLSWSPAPAGGEAAVRAVATEGGDLRFGLLRGSWDLTFRADEQPYPVVGEGEVGIGLLLLAPVALLAPRTRAVALLAITAVVSYAGWVFTPNQIVRHLLPTLAVAAALGGIGVAGVVSMATASPVRRALALAAPLGVILSLLIVPFLFLPNNALPSGRPRLSIDVITGQESAAAYVAREIPAAAAIAATTALPPDTPVGYAGGRWGGAQVYTEARLVNIGRQSLANLGTAAVEVRASLERLGFGYLIWYRPATSDENWRSTLLSTDFLRNHTRILAGDRDGYLFEVLPSDGSWWGGAEPRNLLEDPKLKTAGEPNSSWTIMGESETRRGSLLLQGGSSLTQRVTLASAGPYVLTATSNCDGARERLELGLRWFDAAGAELRIDREQVIPGVEPSEQFLWRRAPPSAAAVVVELTVPAEAKCQIDAAAFSALA
jgi:4-amino-4-deoxy-L-arabinose transferase-like glycosyltransferase